MKTLSVVYPNVSTISRNQNMYSEEISVESAEPKMQQDIKKGREKLKPAKIEKSKKNDELLNQLEKIFDANYPPETLMESSDSDEEKWN